MTGPARIHDAYEEPDQLRDQLRQLFRYRLFILLGVALGLLGGGALSVIGSDSYTSTGEVIVQPISIDPFESGGISADKQLSMGTEKQIASSATVAARAARKLGETTRPAKLQRDLRVSNPPDTQTLRFEYTAADPGRAAKLVNAFVQSYLEYREDAAEQRITKTASKLGKELGPLIKQRRDLDAEIAAEADGPAKDADEAERGSLVTQISELQSRISSYKSLDTTPGNIVRKGEPPAFPSGPGPLMLLLIGAVVGLAGGILLAWIRSVLEPRVRSVADVQANLRAPVLGILPTKPGGGDTLVVGGRSHSNLAEAYRTIAFRLAHDQRFAGRSSLLVVSPREDGDAATVAANLAGAFTDIGHEVLLVEADLRAPMLAGDLPVVAATPDDRGAEWPEGQRLTVDAGEAGEFTLVPGRKMPNVARALGSAQLTRLLSSPSDPSESVVVVTRPLLAHADGMALAKRVDGVLVVCDLQEVRRDDLDRVWELITGAGGRIIGAVLDKGVRRGRLMRILDGGPSHRKWRAGAGRQLPAPPPPSPDREPRPDYGTHDRYPGARPDASGQTSPGRHDDLMTFRG